MKTTRMLLYALSTLLVLSACDTLIPPAEVGLEDVQNTATAISATLYAAIGTPTLHEAASTPTATSTPVPVDEPTPTVEPTATLAPEATEAPTATPTPPPTETPIPTPEPQTLSDDELQIIANLNSWRVRNGAWPLQYNETLAESAQRQADYLISLPQIPGGAEIHQGPNGESSATRAYQAGWPPYGEDSPNRTTASEIAYVGANASVAINYWKGSSIHFQTAINFTFREVGIGIAEHPYGHLYVVDFGSQPGVIPTLIDPGTRIIYLGQEESIFRIYVDAIQSITHYQFVDSLDAEPSEDNWVRLVRTVPAPEGDGPYYVVYLDENLRTLTVEVDPAVNIAWLPENLPDAGD